MSSESTTRSEVIQPGPAEALSGLLGVRPPDFEREGLPLLWHWVYLLERPSQEDLGADGHPTRTGIPAPPEEGRRRMAAGGRVTVHRPLAAGHLATRTSQVVSTSEKEGRSGSLTFVTVRHTISQLGDVSVVEEQDIVYRDAAVADAPAVGASVPARTSLATEEPREGEWRLRVDPTLLFRFSALTYNAHRIHYDRGYATEVERYPGLVVHGPLQALAMAEHARFSGAECMAIEYRMVAPLLEDQGLVVHSQASDGGRAATVRDRHGRLTATARLKPRGNTTS